MSTVWPSVACTGHRTFPNIRWTRLELDRVAAKLRDEHGTTTAITGMALVADLHFGYVAHGAGLDVVAHIPFPQQPDRWPRHLRAAWSTLRGLAVREVVYDDLDDVPEARRRAYAIRLLHARNDGMVAAASAVAVVWDGRREGGTWSVIDNLHRYGVATLPLIWVNPATKKTTLDIADEHLQPTPSEPTCAGRPNPKGGQSWLTKQP